MPFLFKSKISKHRSTPALPSVVVTPSDSSERIHKRSRLIRTPSLSAFRCLSPSPLAPTRSLAKLTLEPYAYSCTALLLDAAAARDAGKATGFPSSAPTATDVVPTAPSGSEDTSAYKRQRRISTHPTTRRGASSTREIQSTNPHSHVYPTSNAEADAYDALLATAVRRSFLQVGGRAMPSVFKADEGMILSRASAVDKPLPALPSPRAPPNSPAGSLGRGDARQGQVYKACRGRGLKGFGSLVGVSATIMAMDGASVAQNGGRVSA